MNVEQIVADGAIRLQASRIDESFVSVLGASAHRLLTATTPEHGL
jgi:hypothetical protein